MPVSKRSNGRSVSKGCSSHLVQVALRYVRLRRSPSFKSNLFCHRCSYFLGFYVRTTMFSTFPTSFPNLGFNVGLYSLLWGNHVFRNNVCCFRLTAFSAKYRRCNSDGNVLSTIAFGRGGISFHYLH